MVSVGARLDERNGIGPGFDHLRVGLALAIVLWHSFGISYGLQWTEHSPRVVAWRPILSSLLPMFFALSGFLVMGSALRINDLRTFITFRVLRILPALATEISLSALVLGPLFTSWNLRAYFTDPTFFAYFGSLIGRVKLTLPGLFDTNPIPNFVNAALWTVGPEILCYVITSLLILTVIYRSKRAMLFFCAAYCGVCLLSDYRMPPHMAEILPTKALVLGFLVGNLIYHYRFSIPFSRAVAACFALASFGLLVLAQQGGHLMLLIYPAVAMLSYLVAFIGLSDLPQLPFFHRGDYSYGIYIFGFPIQQMVAHFFPNMRVWWFNLALALPLTMVMAILSWHLIEKPVLALRKPILAKAERRPPRPVGQWGGREYGLAVVLIGYGLFVATAAKVFPTDRLIARLVGAPLTVEGNGPVQQ